MPKLIAGAFARPDWKPGGEVTASALEVEQSYFRQRLRRHLRLVHGWGVVCGLNVVPGPDFTPDAPWDLILCPGYGIGPCGDEMVVPACIPIHLSSYLWTQPVGYNGDRAIIAIEPSEVPAAHAPAPPVACGCEERCDCHGDDRRVSRIIETVRIVVFWKSPQFPATAYDVCAGGTPPCPPCPETCALPLAAVALPAPGQAIHPWAILNFGEH